MTTPIIIGADAIREALKSMPPRAGVYRMLSETGDILYIGKAKHLPNRVSNYATPNNLTYRILRMVGQVARVEWTVTASEAEALLLEANLIRQHKPRYNILLKDDKSFPYLMFSAHDFPRIVKHRGAAPKGAELFGPFASVGALNATLSLLQRVFLLRPCADTVFKNRSRPCLQYQIKRCSAPCVGYVSEAQYAEQLALARDFLRGKSRAVQDTLTTEMQAASGAMEFERAAHLRDRIKALTQVQQEQGLRASGLTDADVVALYRENILGSPLAGERELSSDSALSSVGGLHQPRTTNHESPPTASLRSATPPQGGSRKSGATLTVFFFRQGLNYGSQNFHPSHDADASDADIVEAFLGQFYHSRLPPKEILLSHLPSNASIVSEALSFRVPYTPLLKLPERGDKRALIDHAIAQAKDAHARAQMEAANVAQHLAGLKTLFNLPDTPTRIEVFDNSHIMGTHQLGAMIVATAEGFKKSAYRTFNRKHQETIAGDDLSMMREMMRRRFKNSHQSSVVSREEDSMAHDSRLTTHDSLPSLLLIDGGELQLAAVREVLFELGLSALPTVAISKGEGRNAGREWFHREGHAPFQLPAGDALLHYIQRLRDEAHRFAIGSHRKRRSAAFVTSVLDDIPGIGPSRKRALLLHFGARSAVESASLAELKKVPGLNAKMAEAVFSYFHG